MDSTNQTHTKREKKLGRESVVGIVRMQTMPLICMLGFELLKGKFG